MNVQTAVEGVPAWMRLALPGAAMLTFLGLLGGTAAATPAPQSSQLPASETRAETQEPPAGTQGAQTSSKGSSPWLFLPVISSNPKLGTAVGVLGAYLRVFDPESRVSMFGVMYEYTSTHSQVGVAFARTSFGRDHHRITAITVLGKIKNNYEDYLGTGQPLQTNDDEGQPPLPVSRKGNWFIGVRAAANYQVLGESAGTLRRRSPAQDCVRGRRRRRDNDRADSEDILSGFTNANNLAYREAPGVGSHDAYRVDSEDSSHGRATCSHSAEQLLHHNAPIAGQASVVLRGYKIGLPAAPCVAGGGGTSAPGVAMGRVGVRRGGGLVWRTGESSSSRQTYPAWGAGLQFIIKPAQRMLANFEYAQGIEDHSGIYLKFGYAW